MFCPSCGEEVEDGSAFCRYCGENIQTTAESIPSDAQGAKMEAANSSGWKTKLSKVVAYAVGIFLILSGLGGLPESVGGGVIILAGGIIALPIVRSKLENSRGVSMGMWATVIIVIVSVVFGGVLFSAADPGPAVEPNGADGETSPASESTPEANFDYELNESFVVSDGEQPIEYTILKSYSTDIIDPGGSRRKPDGEFIVVIMELENPGDEPVDVQTRHLKLVNEDNQEFGADTRTTIDVGYDHRIGIEGLTSEQLQPGLPLKRAVVFDVTPDKEYRLKTEPVGLYPDGEGYYVKLENQELE